MVPGERGGCRVSGAMPARALICGGSCAATPRCCPPRWKRRCAGLVRSITCLLRRTTQQVSLGSEILPAGSLVAAWLESANRDEAVFAEPYDFDPRIALSAAVSSVI